MSKLKINNIFKTISSMKLGRFVRNIENSIGKKLLHDSLVMEGIVDIVNGDNVIHAKNSIVDQGLIEIINLFSTDTFSNNTNAPSRTWSLATVGYMLVGTDTTTGTTHSTNTLTSAIGTGGGTKPNTQSGATSNPSTGQWQVQYTSTWNAGTLPAVTVGEVGLYLYTVASLQGFGTSYPGGASNLFSRMASADGKFTAFLLNTSVPLSIAWTFRLTYAM